MIEPFLLSLIIAKLKKYKLLPIFKSWSIYPMLMCIIIGLILLCLNNDPQLITIFKLLYMISVLILIVSNCQIKTIMPFIPLVLIGSLLNSIAIKVNKGFMPVFPSNSWWTGAIQENTFEVLNKIGDMHSQGDIHTKLIPLTDIFDFGYTVYSIGDLMINVFIFTIIYRAIKYKNKER